VESHDVVYIHLYSPQTVAQQEKKNKESDSLTKSCTKNNDSDKQEGQHPLTGQRAPPISGGT